MRCSIRELARRIGVSDTAINKARADGRLSPDLFGVAESGRPYVKDVDQAMPIVSDALSLNWRAQSSERIAAQSPAVLTAPPKPVAAQPEPAPKPEKPAKKKSASSPGVAIKPAQPRVQVVAPDPAAPSEPVFDDPIDQRTGLPHINVSRQRQAHFDAIAAQAKAEAAAKTHIPREEVTRAAFAVARQVRDTLLLIEERLPDQLASITDPRRIREMLRVEFRAALLKLSAEVRDDVTPES